MEGAMSDLPRDYPFDDPEEPPAAAGDDTIETPEPSDRPEDAPEAEEMGAPSETEAMAEGPPGGDPTEAASTGGSVDDEAVPEPLEPEVEAGQGAGPAADTSDTRTKGRKEGEAPKTDGSPPGDGRARRRWRETAGRVARSRRTWLIAAGILFLLLFTWQRCGIRGCPSVARLASYRPNGASVLLDRSGEKFSDLSPVARQMVELAKLPEHVSAAFIAVEDKRFYQHNGVDWRRVFGAAFANLRSGRLAQGSSTITMQLARNVFPDRIRASDRTFRRKLLEVRVARKIEGRFSKDEILEMYLNHIYFGGGAYGIEAASRMYFGKPASELTLEQSALLAALPKAPSHYDPRRRRERALERRNLVLALMVAQEKIAAEAAAKAKAAPIRVRSENSPGDRPPPAPYFVSLLRDILEDRFGEDLYTRRLVVHTTLDLSLQRAVEEELEKQLRQVEAGTFGRYTKPTRAAYTMGSAQTQYIQGSAVMMENSTGDVLALVGGRDARHSTFNRAIAARRQVGSAFKPFVFATAIDRGWATSMVLDDSPYRLVSGRQTWEPSNFDGQFNGPVTVRSALVQSRNVPTIRLADDVGESRVARLARESGLKGEMMETPVIALGVTEASPLELVTAYTAFAGQGTAVEPRFVLRVEDADGKILWQPEVRTHQVLDPAVAYIMTDMMADAVDVGTGRAVRSVGFRGAVAGKTGTTNDGADAWFIGYTPKIVGGVWIGFDAPTPIAARATGGSVAAPAWGRIMRRAKGWTGGNWKAPDGVVRLTIDPSTGLALESGCQPREGEATEELFLRDETPRTTCPARSGRRRFWLDRAVSWIGDLFEDGEGQIRRRTTERFEEERLERAGRQERDDRRRVTTTTTTEGNRPDDGDDFYRERFTEDYDASAAEPRTRPSIARRGERASQRWTETQEWIDDLADDIADDMSELRPEEERVLDWIERAVDQLENAGVRERDERRLREWLGEVRGSVESSRRSMERANEARVRQWIETIVERAAPNGDVDDETRSRIERDVRRSLRRAIEEGRIAAVPGMR
jgi:penicillin-binding protein 1A